PRMQLMCLQRKTHAGEGIPGRFIFLMNDAPQAESFCYLYEHRPVVDVNDFFAWNLGDVEGDLPDICIGLAEMDETGGDKEVHEFVQAKGPDPVFVQFPSFIVDDGYPEAMFCL